MAQPSVYEVIAEELRREILDGVLAGELPTAVELMGRFGVSKMTVNQAIERLNSEGLIDSQRGRRTRIRSVPPVRRIAGDRFRRAHRESGRAAFLVEAEAGGWEPRVEVLEVGERASSPHVAGRLGVEEGSVVLVRRRRYWANDFPMELATSWIPLQFVGADMRREDTGPGGIYARLEESGHRLHRFVEDVRARPASDGEAEQLRLAHRAPVLTVERLALDLQGIAVELCATVMVAERYELTYELAAE